jgi:hypothetical protein
LSQINNSNPLKIKVLNSHLSSNILITHIPQINRLSLIRQVRDNIIINCRPDHKTTKNVKAKMLAHTMVQMKKFYEKHYIIKKKYVMIKNCIDF